MSVKIKLSYNTDEELAGVIRLLSPALKSWKKSRNQEGRYKKAYAEIELESKVERAREKRQSDTEQRAKPEGTTRNGTEGWNQERGESEKEA